MVVVEKFPFGHLVCVIDAEFALPGLPLKQKVTFPSRSGLLPPLSVVFLAHAHGPFRVCVPFSISILSRHPYE
jgi:hypothetical protein